MDYMLSAGQKANNINPFCFLDFYVTSTVYL